MIKLDQSGIQEQSELLVALVAQVNAELAFQSFMTLIAATIVADSTINPPMNPIAKSKADWALAGAS